LAQGKPKTKGQTERWLRLLLPWGLTSEFQRGVASLCPNTK